jgi:hypothetical protein
VSRGAHFTSAPSSISGLFWVAVACAAVAALAWLASELPPERFFRLHLRWRRLRFYGTPL